MRSLAVRAVLAALNWSRACAKVMFGVVSAFSATSAATCGADIKARWWSASLHQPSLSALSVEWTPTGQVFPPSRQAALASPPGVMTSMRGPGRR